MRNLALFLIFVSGLLGACNNSAQSEMLDNSGDQKAKSFLPAETVFSKIYGTKLTGIVKQFDLRKFDSPVKNQGESSYCTAFGLVAVLENIANQKFGKVLDLSEQQVKSSYKNSYNLDAALPNLRGMHIVTEKAWPLWTLEPKIHVASEKTFATFAEFSGTREAEKDPHEMVEQSLAQNKPLVLAYNNSDGSKGTFFSPTVVGPTKWWGHVVAVVGSVRDKSGKGYYILKNSYGPGSFDSGYIYMPFEYCRNNIGCYIASISQIQIEIENKGTTKPQTTTPPTTTVEQSDGACPDVKEPGFDLKANQRYTYPAGKSAVFVRQLKANAIDESSAQNRNEACEVVEISCHKQTIEKVGSYVKVKFDDGVDGYVHGSQINYRKAQECQ